MLWEALGAHGIIVLDYPPRPVYRDNNLSPLMTYELVDTSKLGSRLCKWDISGLMSITRTALKDRAPCALRPEL